MSEFIHDLLPSGQREDPQEPGIYIVVRFSRVASCFLWKSQEP